MPATEADEATREKLDDLEEQMLYEPPWKKLAIIADDVNTSMVPAPVNTPTTKSIASPRRRA